MAYLDFGSHVTVAAEDIAAGWRPLSEAVESTVEKLIDRAAAILTSQARPGLLDRLNSRETPSEAVEQVLIQAVRRALPPETNIDGAKVVSRAGDDYSERLEWDLASLSGELYFTDRELASVNGGNGRGGRTGRAFTIDTMPRRS